MERVKDILVYIVPAMVSIVVWVGTNEIIEARLRKRTDEISRIKMTSRRYHMYEDHNRRYRGENVSTILFWIKKEINPKLENKMRYSIKDKVKAK